MMDLLKDLLTKQELIVASIVLELAICAVSLFLAMHLKTAPYVTSHRSYPDIFARVWLTTHLLFVVVFLWLLFAMWFMKD